MCFIFVGFVMYSKFKVYFLFNLKSLFAMKIPQFTAIVSYSVVLIVCILHKFYYVWCCIACTSAGDFGSPQ